MPLPTRHCQRLKKVAEDAGNVVHVVAGLAQLLMLLQWTPSYYHFGRRMVVAAGAAVLAVGALEEEITDHL